MRMLQSVLCLFGFAVSVSNFSAYAESTACLKVSSGTYKLANPCRFLGSADGGYSWELPMLPNFDKLHVGDVIKIKQLDCTRLQYTFNTQNNVKVEGVLTLGTKQVGQKITSVKAKSAGFRVDFRQEGYVNTNGLRETIWDFKSQGSKLLVEFSDLRILDVRQESVRSTDYFKCELAQ